MHRDRQRAGPPGAQYRDRGSVDDFPSDRAGLGCAPIRIAEIKVQSSVELCDAQRRRQGCGGSRGNCLAGWLRILDWVLAEWPGADFAGNLNRKLATGSDEQPLAKPL